MARLGTIIQHLEQTFHVKIYGAYEASCSVDGAEFLTDRFDKDSMFHPATLYLCCFTDLPKYQINANLLLIGCPSDSASPASNHLVITEQLSLVDVFNTIEEEILRYHRQKIKREEMFNALYSGNGIQGILNTAYTYLGNPITLCDTSFSVIYFSPKFNDSLNLDYSNSRAYLKEIKIQNMRDNHIIDKLYTQKTPFITRIEQFPYDWVFVSVWIRHSMIAYLCIRALNHEITEYDLEYIEVLSQMISVEMQKDQAYSNPTGYKYEYFLTELLDGHYDRSEYILHQLTQLGHKLSPVYHILICHFRDDASPHMSMQYYCDQVLGILPGSMVLISQDSLTILLPTEKQQPFSAAVEKKLLTFLKLNNMLVGVSFAYYDILLSPYYRRQLLELFNMEYIKKCDDFIIYYEDHFLEHHFSFFEDANFLKASIHPHIILLQQHDQKNHTDYKYTLETYLRNNRNATATAASLNIHKSSLFYRLSKMEELFQIDINNSKLLFAYEYSLHILEYQSNTEKIIF